MARALGASVWPPGFAFPYSSRGTALNPFREVRAVILTDYVDVARGMGFDPYVILRRAKIHPQLLADPESRLPAAAVVQVFEESARASGCETFGLEMAQRRSFASLGPLSVLFAHCGSLRELIESAARYRRHISDLIDFKVEEEAGSTLMKVAIIPEHARPQLIDHTMAMSFLGLRAASRGLWRPEEAHLSHSAPDDERPFRKLFGCRVQFDSTFDGFVAAPGCLDSKWPWANEALVEHVHRMVRLLPLSAQEEPLTDRVSRLIEATLPNGGANCPQVAQALGCSARTLQRGLRQEGSTFTELLDRVRRDMAIRYLECATVPVTTIAQMLGYSSTGCFTRWFIAELGIAPTEWRRQFRDSRRLRA